MSRYPNNTSDSIHLSGRNTDQRIAVMRIREGLLYLFGVSLSESGIRAADRAVRAMLYQRVVDGQDADMPDSLRVWAAPWSATAGPVQSTAHRVDATIADANYPGAG